MSTRGQAYTLEAFVAALLLLGAVVFALQSTAVTPQTASTASESQQQQLERVGSGVLDAAVEDGSLRRTVLYWNDATGTFHGLEPYESAYANGTLPTDFGDRLDRSVGADGVAYNVDVQYRDASGATETRAVVDSGTPSDDAVSVAAFLTLYDDDVRYTAAETPTEQTLANASLYIPDSAPNSGVYNVVRVEVVLWST
ncbi:hypothetical protein EGH21_20240 [Halomicroarcula sp. F13]|uniref:Flagellin n=1 Tax=Haloarcula rubra TaxID=2487747 RepID=A0AAW4PVN8_9EURY|nr:hypothetical protein [Halomicroarcula rubra]MBX0325360.1 hypothetical protein [Halomicroarcula rubra]